MVATYRRLVRLLNGAAWLLPPLLRTVVGLLFIDHGVAKYQAAGGLKGFEFFLKSLKNIPDPALASRAVPLAEIVFGALLVVGLVTRLAGSVLAAEMVTTGFLVKSHDLHLPIVSTTVGGVELDIVYLACLLALVILGPGRASLDAALHLDGRTSEARPSLAPGTARVNERSSSTMNSI